MCLGIELRKEKFRHLGYLSINFPFPFFYNIEVKPEPLKGIREETGYICNTS
jgi:hypothetical protein